MTQQTQAARILAMFPSERRLAAVMGIPQQTVNAWKKTGWVPAWHQKAVLDAGAKLGVNIGPADFFDMDNGDK